jgi:hypothetical protein
MLGTEHLIPRMLRLKVGMLDQEHGTLVLELRMRKLHQCMAQKQGSDKLTRLQKAGPSVASEMLAWKNHLASAVLVQILNPIIDDDSLVNQMLEI